LKTVILTYLKPLRFCELERPLQGVVLTRFYYLEFSV